jgi:fucose 4-O-acetylase-like acetyltransferase
MDLLRGTAILLVIANHAIYNYQQPLSAAPAWLVSTNDVLAPLRMPVVVFMSGLLVTGSLAKPTSTYLAGKMRNIAWPFAVWSVIGYVWVAAVLKLRGDPQRDFGPLDVFTQPFNHLWFLEYIFAFYLIALVARRINPLWVAAAAVVVGLFLDGDVLRLVTLLACFMAGVWCSRHPGLFERLLRRWPVVALAALTLITLVVISFNGFDIREHLRYQPQSLPFVAAALVVVGRTAIAIADQRWTRPMRSVGELSIVYYVTHGYPVEMGALAATTWIGTGIAPIAVGFACGLLAGAVMAWGHPRSRIVHALYSFPRRREAGAHAARRTPVGSRSR